MKIFKKSTQSIFKELGYVFDQEGILTRFLREGNLWKEHLEKTKAILIDTIKKSNAESIAILGSGWLLDVPIDELLKISKKIYCIDIVHPKQILHKYRKIDKIEFITADVTGLSLQVYEMFYKHKNKIFSFEQLNFKPFKLEQNVDFVLSVNILNQLDILLIDAIKSQCPMLESNENLLRSKIQQMHLDFLLNYQFCLISDWNQNTSKNSIETTKELIKIDVPEEFFLSSWTWKFDSQGFYEEDAIVTFTVKAFSNV